MIKQRFKWLTLLIYVPLLTLKHLSAPNSEELVDAAYAHTGI